VALSAAQADLFGCEARLFRVIWTRPSRFFLQRFNVPKRVPLARKFPRDGKTAIRRTPLDFQCMAVKVEIHMEECPLRPRNRFAFRDRKPICDKHAVRHKIFAVLC